MDIRALHFDMKGMIPRPEYMLRLVDQIASLGFNYLLIEFEDKFPYENFPAMVHPAAYTKDQFRQLNEKCREAGIGVIPLLQSVGHLDYFLKHDAYRYLRENGSSYQWCLSDPETYEVWRKMADEILEIFPDCAYFHIGADEASFEHPCPRCAEQDQFQLYVRRVEQCTDYLRERGRKVVIWHDMFRNHELLPLQPLLRKVIPCIWLYREMNEDIIRKFSELGCEFWGASSLQTSYRFRGMSPQERRQNNVDDWAAMNDKYQIGGHIGTIWGKIQCQSPLGSTTLPQAMYMIAYLGESLGRGKISDRSEFNHRFAKAFFGTSDFDMDRVVRYFGIEPEWVQKELIKAENHAVKNIDVIQIWQAMNEIDLLYCYIDDCFAQNTALYPIYREGMAPEKITNNFLDGVRITAERTAAMKKKLRQNLEKYFLPVQVEEFLAQRFDAMLAQNDWWKKVILSAREKCRI